MSYFFVIIQKLNTEISECNYQGFKERFSDIERSPYSDIISDQGWQEISCSCTWCWADTAKIRNTEIEVSDKNEDIF